MCEGNCNCEKTGNDVINAPSHYTGHPCGFQAWDVSENMTHTAGTILDYIFRAGSKDPIEKCLSKARAWIIKHCEGSHRLLVCRSSYFVAREMVNKLEYTETRHGFKALWAYLGKALEAERAGEDYNQFIKLMAGGITQMINNLPA